jgi:hypothetical protein
MNNVDRYHQCYPKHGCKYNITSRWTNLNAQYAYTKCSGMEEYVIDRFVHDLTRDFERLQANDGFYISPFYKDAKDYELRRARNWFQRWVTNWMLGQALVCTWRKEIMGWSWMGCVRETKLLIWRSLVLEENDLCLRLRFQLIRLLCCLSSCFLFSFHFSSAPLSRLDLNYFNCRLQVLLDLNLRQQQDSLQRESEKWSVFLSQGNIIRAKFHT